MRRRASATAPPSRAPMVTVPITPSSSTAISVPVSCCKLLMTLPFGPMTSPILSRGISRLTILGAVSRTSPRGSVMAPAMTARILIRASWACCRAEASTSAGRPSILVSSCRAVTKSAVPATLKSMSPKASSAPEDVGQGDVAVVDLHQAHGDSAHRRLDRHAGVHQRQARRADRRHRGRAIGGQHLRHQAQGVGELLDRGHHRDQGPFGQQAVADLPSLRAAHPAGLAVGVRGHVVVVHVALFLVDADGVEQLVHARHAKRGDVEHLGLTALEQTRAVRGGDHPDLGRQRADIGWPSPVDADAGRRRCAAAPAAWSATGPRP